MKTSGYAFQTHLPVDECIERIIRTPWEFEDVWTGTSLWYNCQIISATRILITFTGGQFRRFRRTEYVVDFTPMNQVTAINVVFQKEIFGLPPMTALQELDAFMTQKLFAQRTGTE